MEGVVTQKQSVSAENSLAWIRTAKQAFGQNWLRKAVIECRNAINLHQRDIVQIFLENGVPACAEAPIDQDGYINCRPLVYFATKVGSYAILKLLIDRGASVKEAVSEDPSYNPSHMYETKYNNFRLICMAIKEDRTDLVQLLLESGANAEGIFVEDVSSCEVVVGFTFLGEAVARGQKEIAKLLADYGANVKEALMQNQMRFEKSSRRRDIKETELAEIVKENIHVISILLDLAFGVNLNTDCEENAFLQGLDVTGYNFVGVSVNGAPITREMLRSHGALNTEKALVTYQDILELEDETRKEELLRRLEKVSKAQGASFSEEGVICLVPLAEASALGLVEIVAERLQAGVSPNEKTNEGICSRFAIEAAAEKGHLEVVKLLAKHPDIDEEVCVKSATEAEGGTSQEIYDYLIARNPNGIDSQGLSFLDHALDPGLEGIDFSKLDKLFALGADINLMGKNPETALHFFVRKVSSYLNLDFCSRGEREKIDQNIIKPAPLVVQYLLDKKADPNIYFQRRDQSGIVESPLYHAFITGNIEVNAVNLTTSTINMMVFRLPDLSP